MIKFVCCFWNAEKYIKNCIRTLKSQKDTEFEVYLIDDISTDNTVEIINKINFNDKTNYPLLFIAESIPP